jgi:predicted O-methyltransferase YrrM
MMEAGSFGRPQDDPEARLDMHEPPAEWGAVDQFLTERLVRPDAALDAALAANKAAALPAIDVSAPQGKFLRILAASIGAQRILEIGTLGGYSTIWLAQALPPDGRLITLEFEPRHAEVARANIDRAGLSDIVEIRIGKALDLLPQIDAEASAPFDLIFIDADKANTANYFDWALRLTRPGSIILVDNVVRKGAILDPNSDDANVQAMRSFIEKLGDTPGIFTTALQTVGGKGYDGFIIALVTPS